MAGPLSALTRTGLLLTPVLALTACTIEVPIPPGSAPPTSMSTPGTPQEPTADPSAAVLPPLTRAQIVGEDMAFDRGSYITEGPVAFADGMTRSDGWTMRVMMVNGESVYENAAGCRASLRYTGLQTPLVVEGEDRASTEALFAFLDPSILPEYLTSSTWLWGENPAEALASIEFLTYRQPATDSTPASSVSLRLFNQPQTALGVTVSCPSDELLDGAIVDVRSRISVVPPRA